MIDILLITGFIGGLLLIMYSILVSFKLPLPIKHKFNGQHYWEIGKKGYSTKKIRKIIKKYFKIQKEFIPFENQYHHFYILMLENNE